MPAARATFSEKQARCWHPVAYAYEVADKPVGATLLGEAVVVWRTRDGRATRCATCASAMALRALARLDCRRLPGVSVSRVALQRRGRLRAYSAVGQRDRSHQSAHAGISLPGALRAGLGVSGRGRGGVRVAGGTRARIRRLEGSEHRAVCVAQRRLAAGGELHRLRPLPVGTSGPAGRSGAAGGSRAQRGDARARAALHNRASRGAQR